MCIMCGGTRRWSGRLNGRAGRIVSFHVCDWLMDTTDLRLDRGMMGDGVIDIRRIRRLVEATGYDGYREVEIFLGAELVAAGPG